MRFQTVPAHINEPGCKTTGKQHKNDVQNEGRRYRKPVIPAPEPETTTGKTGTHGSSDSVENPPEPAEGKSGEE